MQYLSVSGEVTFFKGVYRRHTNFAQETVEMSFNGGNSVSWGNDITCTIARTGDLMSKSWLKFLFPALTPPMNKMQYVENSPIQSKRSAELEFNKERDPETLLPTNKGLWQGARYCDEIGHAMIDYVELSIGGTVIDKLTGHYLSVYHSLVTSTDRQILDHLIGKSGSVEELEQWAMSKQTLYVPLRFFFSNHISCSLPLIALQYHEVKLKVKFMSLSTVVPSVGLKAMKYNKQGNGTGTTDEGGWSTTAAVTGLEGSAPGESPQSVPITVSLVTNLVYLEEEERRQFASSSHEYLIDLVSYHEQQVTSNQTSPLLFFNHPCSELIWHFVSEAAIKAKERFNYSALNGKWVTQNDDPTMNLSLDPLQSACLYFNGYKRFEEMGPEMFREIYPALYHTSVPQRSIYLYSFALEPEDFRPSGSVNLSRIDNVKLVLKHINFDQSDYYDDAGNEFESLPGLVHPLQTTGERTATGPAPLQGESLPSVSIPNPVKGGWLYVYGRHKNVLRIKSGMAGLAYAN